MKGKYNLDRNIHKRKYDSEYISYVETGESVAVFITRDIANSIDTKGKWADVFSTKGDKNDADQWDFTEIVIEIFPRKKKPVYPEYASDEDKKIHYLANHPCRY